LGILCTIFDFWRCFGGVLGHFLVFSRENRYQSAICKRIFNKKDTILLLNVVCFCPEKSKNISAQKKLSKKRAIQT